MRALPDDILGYQDRLDAESRPICDVLLETIERELPDADRKVWHAHPVWFFDGNPVVGYHPLKASVRLLFWSGQSFGESGLAPEGSFQAAEARYTTTEEIDVDAVRRWLAKARDVQWNYRDIRLNRGLVPLHGLDR
jgi:hypothetical protein